jgi:hypothetical protein
MNDKLNQTQRILRSPKVMTDDRGRTVWAGSVDTANLELMSTQQLQRVIEKGNARTADRLRQLTASEDGLLARNVDNGEFEIVSDEELRELLDDAPADGGTEDELSLVSTQMLRIVLDPEDEESAAAKEPAESGFNPYDHN